MKTYIQAATLLMVLLIVGCSEELNVFPEDSLSTSDLSESDIPTFENGVYENLKDAFIPFYILDFDGFGENFQYPFGPTPLQNILPTDGGLFDIWSGLYSAIFNANVLLEVASQYKGEEIDKALATGYFVRAYSYYNLVTRFGGVPLLPQNSTQPVPRASEAETWDFILNDLDQALQRAPDFSSPLFVSEPAINALLARTHLALGNMDQAASFAQSVIATNRFSFEEQYANVFLNDGGSELIFGLSNFEGDLEIWRAANATDFDPPGGASFMPRQDLFDTLFEAGDPRREVTFIDFNGQLMLNKYSVNQTIPVLVSRISEMYLIRAEALGLNGGGLQPLNAIRIGRGLTEFSANDESEFQELVALERRRELFSEGFHFYDLVRTGRAVEELQFVADINGTRLPIPQQEVDLAGLEQNPGY